MSQENVEIVRQVIRDFNESGPVALRRYLREDVEWETPPNVPEAGTYRGIDEVMGYIQYLEGAFEQLHLELEELLVPRKDQVLVALRVQARGAGSGESIDMPWWHLWTLAERKGVRVRSFLHEAEALEAAGLSE